MISWSKKLMPRYIHLVLIVLGYGNFFILFSNKGVATYTPDINTIEEGIVCINLLILKSYLNNPI